MSVEQGSYAPSFRACKLFRRRSKSGSTYFTGRLGGMRVSVVKSREVVDDGETEVWSPLLSEPPAKGRALPGGDHSIRSYDKQLDDEIPF